MKQVSNKRKLQAEETKSQILETANRLFLELGVKNISVREICRECGITNGAFYHHFTSKDDIILRLSLEGYDEYVNQQIFTNAENDDPLELIGKFIYGSSEYFQSSGPELIREAYKIVVATEVNAFDSRSQKHLVTLHKIIERGQLTGRIRTDLSPEAIFVYIISLTTGILVDWNLFKKDYRANVIGAKEISILLESLKAR